MCEKCNNTGKIRFYRSDLEEFDEIECECNQTHPEIGGYPCWRYDTAVSMLENMTALSVDYFKDICNATHNDGYYPSVTSNIYDFKPITQLELQHGLPDPFLMPDGKRVSSAEDWQKQQTFIKTMLAHYQYGEMPETPVNVEVVQTLYEEIYNGTAIRKEYLMKLQRRGNSVDFHFGLIKPKIGS